MINKEWDQLLANEYQKNYFQELIDFINEEYKLKTIYPEYNDIFNAFKLTNFNDVKVVIIGQDPYHGINQAHGLSFSVKEGITKPPSLLNIYKELKNDLGIEVAESGDLTSWAKEGVLLLNSILTVEKDKPCSYKNKGWETFTDQVILLLNNKKEPIVFILWGSYAKSKKNLITNNQHLILESVHPSPLSAHRGFFGSKPFSQANNFFIKNNEKPINWQIKRNK